MAEMVLIPVAERILGKLGNLALDQVALLWALRGELRKLNDTVSAIRAVLRDAEAKQFLNHQVRDWLGKLSNVMYDADDVLDEFSTDARRQAAAAAADGSDDGTSTSTMTCWSRVCSLISTLAEQLMSDLRMAHEIRAIREKLEHISKDKDAFQLEVSFEPVVSIAFSETDSCPPTIVVGREGDKMKIIDMLLNSNCNDKLAVVPIVGIGGLGKTTLAQLVFDDVEVKTHFEKKVWVYVSQSFDIKGILGKMLQSITGVTSIGDIALDVLQARLRGEIEGKRFLFVLDDVWEEENQSWESLGKYLTSGVAGSKVLVTTRSAGVAEVSSRILKSRTSVGIVLPYTLEGLSEEESWSLMVEMALPWEVPKNPDLIRVGREILAKCRGVPLAVNTIARVLMSFEHPEIEWPLMLQKEWSIFGDKSNNPIMSTLRLSFNNLPSHLKQCFAYCKLFPKGHVFDIRRLVHLWIAQGYVESGDQCVEDMGFRCFKTLWWRSFFHEVERDELGNLTRCRMHDLMHDLADSIDTKKIMRSSSSTLLNAVAPQTRHLAMVRSGGHLPDDEDQSRDVDRLRTLVCNDVSFSREEYEQVLHSFRRLRALAIDVEESDPDAVNILHSLGKLKHLRFLGFNSDRTTRLPDSVTSLFNLEVLDLRCGSLKELPRDIRKLVNLKHLYLRRGFAGAIAHMPKGIGELTSLQTLPVFVVSARREAEDVAAGMEELKGLNELRGELAIKNLAVAPAPGVYVLKEKLHLQSLLLDWGDHNDDAPAANDEELLEMLCPHPNLGRLTILNYGGLKLPNWMSAITYLVEISLLWCEKCEVLPPLQHIPSLKKLTIEGCPNLKGIITSSNDVLDLVGWPQFPCLEYLWVWDCPNLTRMPAFPTVETELVLTRASVEPLLQTIKMGSNHAALSKLKKLTLRGLNDDLESAPEDGFKGLVSLRELILWDFVRGGNRLPGWICSITSLVDIQMQSCETIQYLPPLHQLPSLKKLLLQDCGNLEGLAASSEEAAPVFPCLASLKIRDCPYLTRLPLFPTVESELVLSKTSSRPLLRTMEMIGAEVPPLSKVTSLKVVQLEGLGSFPEQGFGNLTSLQVLEIDRCYGMASLPGAVRQLGSLQRLSIKRCPQLVRRCSEGGGEDWPNICHIPDIQLSYI